MAKLGKYGPKLEEEAKFIETRILPYSLYRAKEHERHQYSVIFIAIALLASFGVVMGCQLSNEFWLTEELRVEFNDPALREYSGCYEVDPDMAHAGRKNYVSQSGVPVVFGYCQEDHHWVLFEEESDDDNGGNINNDPCTTKKPLVHSADTDTFDIGKLLLQFDCERL